MTGPEHYDEAEGLLATATDIKQTKTVPGMTLLIARAQVHAILALTWATEVIATGRDS